MILNETLLIIAILFLIVAILTIKIVPQQEAWLIERLGKFDQVLQPGLNLLVPFVQRVAYKHNLKEMAVDVHAQTAISNDNVSLSIDGVLYVKIVDPIAASYGVHDPYYAIAQLAKTAMRSEIGKIPLDKTFEERENLNHAIVSVLNEAAKNWGIQCLRYEIKDIQPPNSVLSAMELQVAAERQKRAQILDSEGSRQAKINNAEGIKAEIVLNSEASYTDQVNRARGEAEAIKNVAAATAASINLIGNAILQAGGTEAVSYKVAEQYVEAFKNIAQKSNTVIVPANINDPSAMVSSMMSIYKAINEQKKQ